MTTEGRRVLEVHSHGGKVLEGVYELAERAAADGFVADLAAGCGVRAKVLELGVAGVKSRAEDVAAAWAATPFPPAWFVVHQQGQVVALAVYGSELGADAAQKQHELSVSLGVDIDVSVHIHPNRPRVGEPYRSQTEAEKPYTQAEADEGVQVCEAMLASGQVRP